MYKCTCLIIDNVQIGSKGLNLVRQSLFYSLLLSDSGDRRVEKAGDAIKKEKQKHFQWCNKKLAATESITGVFENLQVS